MKTGDDRDRDEPLGELIARLAPSGSDSADCPDANDLAAWAEGAEPGGDASIETHLASCAECRAVAMEIAPRGARATASEATTSPRGRLLRMRPGVLWTAAAATVALLATLWWRSPGPDSERVDPIASSESLLAMLPDEAARGRLEPALHDPARVFASVRAQVGGLRAGTGERLLSPRRAVAERRPEFVFEVPPPEPGDSWSYRIRVESEGAEIASWTARQGPSEAGPLRSRPPEEMALGRAYSWSVSLDPVLHPGFEQLFAPTPARFRIIDGAALRRELERLPEPRTLRGAVLRAALLSSRGCASAVVELAAGVDTRGSDEDEERSRLLLTLRLLEMQARLDLGIPVAPEELRRLEPLLR